MTGSFWNLIEFHKDSNKANEILWNSGTRIYGQILSVGLRQNTISAFNGTQYTSV